MCWCSERGSVSEPSTELQHEQHYVDELYGRLDELRDRAERELTVVRGYCTVGHAPESLRARRVRHPV